MSVDFTLDAKRVRFGYKGFVVVTSGVKKKTIETDEVQINRDMAITAADRKAKELKQWLDWGIEPAQVFQW